MQKSILITSGADAGLAAAIRTAATEENVIREPSRETPALVMVRPSVATYAGKEGTGPGRASANRTKHRLAAIKKRRRGRANIDRRRNR
jgi:hypothetical protein